MLKKSVLFFLCLAFLSVNVASDSYGWGRRKKAKKPMVEYASYGDTVKIHYTGKLTDGTVFDSSREKETFEFKLGDGTVLPSVEEAIIGMTKGESKTANIAVDKAYGVRKPGLIKVVDSSQFPKDFEPKIGLYLKVKQNDGKDALVRIIDIKGEQVTLDANHPLAGKDLIFNIQLVDIV